MPGLDMEQQQQVPALKVWDGDINLSYQNFCRGNEMGKTFQYQF